MMSTRDGMLALDARRPLGNIDVGESTKPTMRSIALRGIPRQRNTERGQQIETSERLVRRERKKIRRMNRQKHHEKTTSKPRNTLESGSKLETEEHVTAVAPTSCHTVSKEGEKIQVGLKPSHIVHLSFCS